MPQSWLFRAGKCWLPEGDPFAAGLGGTEQAVIHLTEALAARGHAVMVDGAARSARIAGGVHWLAPGRAARAEVTVAVNDARLLPSGARLPMVWFHNEVEFWRESRKRRLGALWRHRPAAVFIGSEQARHASRLLGFRARATIPYALSERILQTAPAAAPPGPHAIFTSQAYRGLREVIGLWRTHIAPNVAGALLSAFIDAGDVAAYSAMAAGEPSIRINGRIGNDAVLDMLRSARVLIAPGHRSETYCMAAAEAIALGVPVVTHGIGSLKERVADGHTGFVCRGDWQRMAARLADILQDDRLWARLHAAGVAQRANDNWDRAAQRWEAFAAGLGGQGR